MNGVQHNIRITQRRNFHAILHILELKHEVPGWTNSLHSFHYILSILYDTGQHHIQQFFYFVCVYSLPWERVFRAVS
jgi:hypothetical protein